MWVYVREFAVRALHSNATVFVTFFLILIAMTSDCSLGKDKVPSTVYSPAKLIHGNCPWLH